MKLYTVCKTGANDVKLKYSQEKIRLEEYSFGDYLKFASKASRYYVSQRFYWYETDMSDSDSGTIYDNYPINYTNMVIKDGELYAVLVRTRAMFPDYFLLTFKKGHTEAALGGGYEELDYDWWIKETDDLPAKIEVSNGYVMICEHISRKNGSIARYKRTVTGFLPNHCITEDGKIVGLMQNGEPSVKFIFSDKDTLFTKEVKLNDGYEVTDTRALLKINEALLDMNIRPITYPDFKDGKYEIVTDKLEELI